MIILWLSLILLFADQAFAHSGGTNKYGCHAGSQPCHCHPPKDPDQEKYLCSSKPHPTFKPTPTPRITKSPKPLKIQDVYRKVIGSVKYILQHVHKNPRIVKSCDEWVMVSKLMAIAIPIPIDFDKTFDLKERCRKVGHRKFGKHMKGLIGLVLIET